MLAPGAAPGERRHDRAREADVSRAAGSGAEREDAEADDEREVELEPADAPPTGRVHRATSEPARSGTSLKLSTSTSP